MYVSVFSKKKALPSCSHFSFLITFTVLHSVICICVCVGGKWLQGMWNIVLRASFTAFFLVFFLLFGLWSLTACGRRLESWLIGKIQCTFWQNTPV